MSRTLPLLLAWLTIALQTGPLCSAEPAARPNILWITCEDMSPNLGCFGDKSAITPNLDRFARQGVRYTHAFSVAGVCAPSRSCLITGMYPSSLGTHHMRCTGTLPEAVRCFPEYLRQAGYYCSNNSKEDYNFKTPKESWDESSRQAHWRKRGKGQPFFSVFNLLVTHESQIRTPEETFAKQTARLTKEERHDPDKIGVPPFHPDTPAVRRDWARYHDLITAMDKQAADLLAELDKDGLTEDTIVFFFSDHGVGLPRGKRWLYDTGMRVPLIIRFPEKFAGLAPAKPNEQCDRLVSFVDLGPTVLSLAGVKAPQHMQGQAFLGEKAAKPREYVYGIRDRMDERYDMTRAVRDRRYKYIRNYLPHLPWSQPLDYMDQMPTMREWRKLAADGKLTGAPALFMQPTKPIEELYDTDDDPHEVRNLARSREHSEVLERLRKAHVAWQDETRDLGLLPEAEMHIRSAGKAPYDMVRKEGVYPLGKVREAAFSSVGGFDALPRLRELLRDEDPAVRWWAAVGMGALPAKGKIEAIHAKAVVDPLRGGLRDDSPHVRVAAAEYLCSTNRAFEALPVLLEALKHDNEWVRLAAVNAIDRLGAKGREALPQLREAAKDKNPYVVRVVGHALKTLGAD